MDSVLQQETTCMLEIVLDFDPKNAQFQNKKKVKLTLKSNDTFITQVYSAFGHINVNKDLCVNCLFQLDEDSINVISIDT